MFSMYVCNALEQHKRGLAFPRLLSNYYANVYTSVHERKGGSQGYLGGKKYTKTHTLQRRHSCSATECNVSRRRCKYDTSASWSCKLHHDAHDTLIWRSTAREIHRESSLYCNELYAAVAHCGSSTFHRDFYASAAAMVVYISSRCSRVPLYTTTAASLRPLSVGVCSTDAHSALRLTSGGLFAHNFCYYFTYPLLK